jgi:hypothetical protein
LPRTNKFEKYRLNLIYLAWCDVQKRGQFLRISKYKTQKNLPTDLARELHNTIKRINLLSSSELYGKKYKSLEFAGRREILPDGRHHQGFRAITLVC